MSGHSHPAEQAIREHNDGCDAACDTQRPVGRSFGCGYQKHDGSLIYSRRCPSCPKDWKIDYAAPPDPERPDEASLAGRFAPGDPLRTPAAAAPQQAGPPDRQA